jgi:hypothetical protein
MHQLRPPQDRPARLLEHRDVPLPGSKKSPITWAANIAVHSCGFRKLR